MRKLLPAVAAAAALLTGLAPAAAQPPSRHHHERSRSHVSLHLTTHSVLKGNGLAVRGKVRPSGRHRVKIVFRGPSGGERGVTTKANGTFARCVGFPSGPALTRSGPTASTTGARAGRRAPPAS